MATSFVDLQGMLGKFTVSYSATPQPHLTLKAEEEGGKTVEVKFTQLQLERIKKLEFTLETYDGKNRQLILKPSRNEATHHFDKLMDIGITAPFQHYRGVRNHSLAIEGLVTKISMEHVSSNAWEEIIRRTAEVGPEALASEAPPAAKARRAR